MKFITEYCAEGFTIIAGVLMMIMLVTIPLFFILTLPVIAAKWLMRIYGIQFLSAFVFIILGFLMLGLFSVMSKKLYNFLKGGVCND